ncbi:MAG: hypothetical protein M3371_09475 [Acidobacteriota bacterium]|nr:hypothetical protein [Acidobacteriota bacterium]
MKRETRARSLASMLVIFCLLAAPIAVSAKKGEKNYKRGLQHETAQQWERAAQEFALAVAANPSDTEYQLHYRRAIFQASQKFMEQGRTLAEQGDYKGAYNAYRQAYGYDPVNELALAEMQRMVRLQREKDSTGPNGNGNGNGSQPEGSQHTPSSYQPGANGTAARIAPVAAQVAQQGPGLPAVRSEQLRVINYSGDLEQFARQMATELELNIIFDRDFPKRSINVNLRNVTAARALDLVFVSQGLFFQKLDRRTILVADQSKRPQYQQLVLRTFYLQNIDPNEARGLIQAALPATAGRTPQAIPNKATNSITVRDTPENIRLIEELLRGVDKDRAEVVMDVQIYEVSRTNLLQLGNQIGNEAQLGNLGGVSRGLALLAGSRQVAEQALPTGTSTALGAAFILPTTALSAFQAKDNTRLLASTQVHAFDSEPSITRIGQKVPVQTAQVSPFSGVGTGNNQNPGAGVQTGLFGGTGFPVIQYQDTGLILKFTPQVFPNHDVQVKMEIESNDVIGGANALTPTFSQRNVSGMARIPNNRTMMIASIAQDRESRGRRGLPVLGLIPVLGRLFSTPTRNDVNSDIVITVTPHVLRAPNVTPEDLELRPTGTQTAPASETLEAMVRQADREDQLAAARQLPKNPVVQLPTAAATEAASAAPTTTPASTTPATETEPAFVPAPKLLAGTQTATPAALAALPVAHAVNAGLLNSITNSLAATAKTAPIIPAVNAPENRERAAAVAMSNDNSAGGAALFVMANQREMRAGGKQRLMIFVKTDVPLNLAAASLRFDPKVLRVVSVTKGSLFGEAPAAAPAITPSIDAGRGTLLALVAPASGTAIKGMGVMLFVEIEALAAGNTEINFDSSAVHLMSTDGRNIPAQFTPVRLTVK